jgi:soluble lytic murein transglycosylase-like protein
LPTVLHHDDATAYTAIFAAQETGDWKAADALIGSLTDRSLLGTVLAQRYLTRGYKTSFEEARDWLNGYAMQPEAMAIHLLAQSRAEGRAVPALPPSNIATIPVASTLLSAPTAEEYDRPREFALGLSAWRESRWQDASRHFQAVATSSRSTPWYVAAGAYWAARSELKLDPDAKVERWYSLAAAQPNNFYELLARRRLGLSLTTDEPQDNLTGAEVSRITATPGGRRALALLQIGQTASAEAELRQLAVGADIDLLDVVMATADFADLPDLGLATSEQTSDAAVVQRASYPVPRWRPRNGFTVDRALLYALIREESRFDSNARSGCGAIGLMQLMPDTARAVARIAGIAFRGPADLADPATNLSIGQEYVRELIDYDLIQHNLILLLAAYNTGPGPLVQWLLRADVRADPLLFIETLPRLDTRLYVQHVLTDLWTYRQRLHRKAPDLAALAADLWPAYVTADPPDEEPERHASAR